jgi:hypothetical protein
MITAFDSVIWFSMHTISNLLPKDSIWIMDMALISNAPIFYFILTWQTFFG